MYFIDSGVEVPNISYLYDRISELASKGIKIGNVGEMYKTVFKDQQAAGLNIKSKYGINNPNSPREIQWYFTSIMNEEMSDICMRKGKFSLDKHALKLLIDLGYEEARDIAVYRKLKKYAETLATMIQHVHKDGRVRPKVDLLKTNRVNYSEPALMNIQKDILWDVIVPEKEGNVFISVDIKTQEPWIMIHMLNIEKILGLIRSSSIDDLYTIVFEDMYGEEPTTLQRSEFKTCWNAMTYGSTYNGLKKIAYNIDCRTFYNYFNGIPEFKRYRGRCYGLAKKGVQEVETYFGTYVRANEFGSKLQRVLMDIPIQGTGADLLALLVENFDSQMNRMDISTEELDIKLSRHDEIILEADEDFVAREGLDSILLMAKDIFEHTVDDWLPFKVKIQTLEPSNIFDIED
jgi:DNA polymerase I-like protein with 3'-5' exonuclease and polymerase domains